LGGEKEACPTT
jgi:hypothetical protein